MKIYFASYQSVDPDEAGIGGVLWSVDEDDIYRYIEHVRENPWSVDYEFLVYEYDLDGELGDIVEQRTNAGAPLTDAENSEVLDILEELAWSETNAIERIVVFGELYPGAEQRRLES